MAYFQSKNPNLNNFFGLEDAGILYGHLVGLFCGQLVYFVTIWYILWIFGMLYQKIWQPWSQ
jgi:hypothetical protein